MYNSRQFTFVLLFFTILITSISSCKKDESGSPDVVQIIPTTYSTIGGKVTGTDGLPASNFRLKCNGLTTITDSRGFYLFRNIQVPKGRCVIEAENGYYRTAKPVSGGVTYCDFTINKNSNEYQFNSAAGGTITDVSGVSIIFQPSSVVQLDGSPYNGQVNVEIEYFYPGQPGFYSLMPAHDNLMMGADGKKKFAYSFGTTKVRLLSTGNKALQLDPSKPATLTIPIDNNPATTPPQNLNIASFNPEKGIWESEGTAVKSGNNYISVVKHFSWWGAMSPLNVAMITGQVKDINGHPITSATVEDAVEGFVSRTDINGLYVMDVYDGANFNLSCAAYKNMGEMSPSISTPVMSAGQIYTMPDFIFSNATIINGNTVDCNASSTVGFVTIFDSMEYAGYAIASNNFSLFAGTVKSVQFNSFQGNLYNQTNYVAGASGSISSAGNIQLCTFTPTNGNVSITFTSPLTGTSTSTVHFAYADIFYHPTAPWVFINITSVDSLYFLGLNNYLVNFSIPVHLNYIPGTMPWTVCDTTFSSLNYFLNPISMYGEAYGNATFNSFYAIGVDKPATPGTTTITQFGPIGSAVEGSWTGNIEVYDDYYNQIVSGTASMTFNVPRRM